VTERRLSSRLARRGVIVTNYEIYRSEVAGHIVWSRECFCATDDEVLAEARFELRASEEIEVWTGRGA